MKKIAYILGYIGSICTIALSLINIFVKYSYYLNQPTSMSQRSVISSVILIFLSSVIAILVHKLDFKKTSSSLLLIFITIVSLLLPGIINYEAKLRYFPQYINKNFNFVIGDILYMSLDYISLILVLLAGILFLIPNNVKRKF